MPPPYRHQGISTLACFQLYFFTAFLNGILLTLIRSSSAIAVTQLTLSSSDDLFGNAALPGPYSSHDLIASICLVGGQPCIAFQGRVLTTCCCLTDRSDFNPCQLV